MIDNHKLRIEIDTIRQPKTVIETDIDNPQEMVELVVGREQKKMVWADRVLAKKTEVYKEQKKKALETMALVDTVRATKVYKGQQKRA